MIYRVLEIVEMVQFLDPETAKILQFLDPEIVEMDKKNSVSRNRRNGVVSGSVNRRKGRQILYPDQWNKRIQKEEEEDGTERTKVKNPANENRRKRYRDKVLKKSSCFKQ